MALILLWVPAYRQIRLIRVHSFSSLILGCGSALLVLVFGSLRLGFEAGLLVGLILSLSLLAYLATALWSAVWAYRGRSPPVPGVKLLANRIERAFFVKPESAPGPEER